GRQRVGGRRGERGDRRRDVGQRHRGERPRAMAARVEAVLAVVRVPQEIRPDLRHEVLLARLAEVDVGGRRAEVDRLAAGGGPEQRGGDQQERPPALQNVYLR